MTQDRLTMAQQVAEAARVFQQQHTSHAPKAVTVVLAADTLVITLHGALTPAEQALAWMGLAWKVHLPAPEMVAARRQRGAAAGGGSDRTANRGCDAAPAEAGPHAGSGPDQTASPGGRETPLLDPRRPSGPRPTDTSPPIERATSATRDVHDGRGVVQPH